MPRVVSLLASGTEIVCALGHRGSLVGRSHECDFPAGIQDLPQVSLPSFPVTGSSRSIDLAVRDRLRKALAIYEVDGDLLTRLEPDVVVTQTQCEVCAVSPEDVERAVCALTQRDIEVVALEPHGLADIWTDIEKVAAALGVADGGTALIERLRGAMSEWIDPLMTAPRNMFHRRASSPPLMNFTEFEGKDFLFYS